LGIKKIQVSVAPGKKNIPDGMKNGVANPTIFLNLNNNTLIFHNTVGWLKPHVGLHDSYQLFTGQRRFPYKRELKGN
jgi:hypothetical protein